MKTLCKIYATKLENPCKINEFLRKYNLLKLTQEEVENWSGVNQKCCQYIYTYIEDKVPVKAF